MPLNWERLENIIQFSEVTESGVVSRNRSSLTGQTGADGTAATLFQFMMHWCVNSSRGDVSGTLRSAPTAKVDDEQGASHLVNDTKVHGGNDPVILLRQPRHKVGVSTFRIPSDTVTSTVSGPRPP